MQITVIYDFEASEIRLLLIFTQPKAPGSKSQELAQALKVPASLLCVVTLALSKATIQSHFAILCNLHCTANVMF